MNRTGAKEKQMNQLEPIGLLALTVTAMLAFAASASAARLTSPTGTEYGTGSAIKATAGMVKITVEPANIECTHSWFAGTITSQGTGVPVKISLSTLDFEGCNYPVTVTKTGTLELSAIGTGNEVNGTLKWSGAEIDTAISLGTCVFTTSGTDIGTLTGGKTASIDFSGTIPRTGGNFLCGSSAVWESSYSVVTPDELWLDS